MNILNFTLIFIAVFLILLVLSGCSSVKQRYIRKVNAEFVHQPLLKEEILTEKDVSHLPAPVKKYLTYTGAIGKNKVQNMYITFEASMKKNVAAKPMRAVSEQYNFFGDFTRIFIMRANMAMIPYKALHIYNNQKASFVVRVASLFNAVNVSGEILTKAETVTLLNDICVFAPGALIDKRFTWQEADSARSIVTLKNGDYTVSATLHFNVSGELVNFVSDDRYALQDDGSMKQARWSTPIGNYKEIDGRKIPTYAETIWNYPEGDFAYGKFTLKDIKFNLIRRAK